MTTDAELRIGGNIDELKEATNKATAEVKKMSEQMQSSLNSLGGVFQKIHGQFMGFTAVLAGGAAFKAVIGASAEWTGQAQGLAKSLGITTEQASVMNVALNHIGVGSDVVIGATQKLAKQIHTNGQAFDTLGVKVKDANGQYRPTAEIMGEVNKKLVEIKNPIQQAIAGQAVYGKGWAEIKPILKLTTDQMQAAEERAKQLHLIVGPDGVAQTKQYKEQMRDLNLVGKSLEIQFGNAVMPVFIKLGAFMGEIGPAAGAAMGASMESLTGIIGTLWSTASEFVGLIADGFSAIGSLVADAIGGKAVGGMELFRNALKVVEMAFVGLKTSVQLSTEIIKAIIESVVDRMLRFADAAGKALKLDFSGAKAAWQNGTKIIEDTQRQHWDKLVKIASDGQAQLDAIAMRQGDPAKRKSAAPEFGGPSYDFDKEKKGPADKSRMSEWEAKLGEAKVYYEKENDLKEYSKAQEKAYWQSILSTANVTGQERIAITRKVSTLELEIMKKQMEQRKALNAEAINAHEKTAEDGIKLEEMLSQREYDLGNINKQQLLALQQQYEDRRFDIQKEAQAARISAMLGDPNMDPVALQKLLDQMGEIQRKYAMNSVKISSDMAVESRTRMEKMIAPISSAFDKSITGMIQGTLTLKKALGNIFNAILAEFVNLGVQMATKWAAMELAKTAATQKGTVIRAVLEKMGLVDTAAAQTAASVTTAAAKKTEAAAVIPAEAAEAAGAAASSVAGIPIVGPAMAAAAFAETMAMVMGGMAVASASGGFDIPAGVNPMTQLHAEEMVLPAHIANPLRDSIAGGGSGSGLTVHITAMDSQDVHRALMNGGALQKAMKNMQRNFQR